MKRLFPLALLAFASIPTLPAQSIQGSMSGTVKDPGGATIPVAQVTATLLSTGLKRQATTDERGVFNIVNLEPGVYNVTVQAEGFKTLSKTSITLPASERLVVGELVMALGDVKDTVTVTASAAMVQTASAERAGVLSNKQVENLLIRSRDIYSMLSLVPGVQYEQEGEQLSNVFQVYANGGRNSTNDVSVDGISTTLYATPWASSIAVSMDSVAEVKVLTGTFQAEYGRGSGANIQVVSKSGTKAFHGMGAYFKRHEQFNANSFFNNRLSQPKSRYRFNTWSYNIGGPVLIPKTGFNRGRDKVFFFWSQEYWPTTSSALASYTVPTQLERDGDFSQSLDLNSKVIAVLDPITRAALPGNKMPVTQVNKNGQALLKFLPQPNFLDRTVSGGRYNYLVEQQAQNKYWVETLKLDYNITSKDMVSVNLSERRQPRSRYYNVGNMSNTWPQLAIDSPSKGWAVSSRYNKILSPTLVNEFNFGVSFRSLNDQPWPASLKANQRDSIGFAAAQINPKANPLNLVPDATFGGISNPAPVQIDYRFPTTSFEPTYQFGDGLTKIFGPHTIKVGIQADALTGRQSGYSYYRGKYDFGTSTQNPLDTKHPYANALFGVYNTYVEESALLTYQPRYHRAEWYAQDTWKVNRRLTLDYGLRFHWDPWPSEANGVISGFVPGLWDRAKQPKLIQPAMVDGKKVGVNPVTGQVYPVTTIGALAPGIGDPLDGVVTPQSNAAYKNGLVNNPGILLGPRFGFALDVFGNGKTAIRGGGGILYSRPYANDVVRNLLLQIPQITSQTLYYGNVDTVQSAQGFSAPASVRGIEREPKMPTIYNMSLSVQHDLGFRTVLDVAYVGSLGRHLSWQRQFNDIPLGRNWDPAYADPTSPKVALPVNFLRPVTGYQNLPISEYAGSSNYHSLQVQVNRRFANSLQYGASWTWSKSMDFGSADDSAISPLLNLRSRYYGLSSYDRTFVLKPNFVWDLPRASQLLGKSRLVKGILNNWQMSGILTFMTGQPTTIGFSTTVPTDITGTPSVAARIDVTGNPFLPKDQRRFDKNFRTDVLRLPAVGTIGNTGKYILRLPGVNNWDLAFIKNIPIRESMRFQLRWEMYNAFNHTQFTSFDTGARFDPQGNQVNPNLGQFTAARNPRICQGSLRFQF